MVGDRLRLAFMLYVGEAPTDATDETAHRVLDCWITVEEAAT